MFVVGGESLIDLVPSKAGGERIAHPGGSPYNCAIALSKLGNDTGFLCPISTDQYGDVLLAPLAEAKVKVLLQDRVAAPTTLAIVTLDGQGKAQYEFRRDADHAFTADGMVAALPEKLELFQFGGFGPILPEDTAVWTAVVKAAIAKGATITIDPNVRPSLIDDFAGYKQRLSGFLDLVHLVKVSDEDLASLDAAKSIEQHAADMLARANCELVVVTLGEKGSRAFTANGTATADIYAPPVFGDTVGAGDSLMAGILTWLDEKGALKPGKLGALGDADLAAMLRFGAVVAGLNCGEIGCKPPTRPQVDAVLAKG